MLKGLVGLVPCYQGAGRVGSVVTGARRYLPDVLVVDDGSTDDSGREAREAGAEVLRRPQNGGKGAALREGLATLLERDGWNGVVLLDADGQHATGDLPRLAEAAARGAEFVIGSRLADRQHIPGKRFWANYIGARVLTRMTGQEIEDSQSGYRLLSRRAVSLLLPRLWSCGYAIESEMLIKASSLGLRFHHVPVETIYGDNPSHYRPFRDTWVTSWLSVWFKVFETD